MSTRVAELLEAEDFSAAAAAFAAAPNADDADLLFEALDGLDRDDDLEQLEHSLCVAEALIETRPKRDEAHLVAIECLRKLGRGDEALGLARKHVGREAVRSQLYQLLCLHGRFEEADKMLPTLAGLDDSEGNALYNLGTRMQGTRALERAIALYRGAVVIGCPQPQTSINLGIALLSLGRAVEAAETARAALVDHPTEPNLLANVIDASVRSGDRAGLRTALPMAAEAVGKSARCRQCDHRSEPAACASGCGALLEDLSNAWTFLGEEGAAVATIEAACGESPPEPRVRYALARALVARGELADATALVRGKRAADAPPTTLSAPACVALLSTPPTVADAGSFYAYRAQAAIAWAAGDLPRAAGALCAALFIEPGGRDQLAQDASWAALRGREPSGSEPLRPPSVSEEAWWDPADKEWVLGPRDKQNGAYKYYRPDGTCCNESSLVEGKPHGPFLRFHENGEVSQDGAFEHGELHGTRRWTSCEEATTENTRQDGMSLQLWRSEIDYASGRVLEIRHYDRAGNQCAPDGTRYPDRPRSVSTGAAYYPDKRHWRFGEVDASGEKRGVWKTWNEHGQLIKEEHYLADELHGPFRAYHADGSEAAVGEYVEGEQQGLFTYLRGPVVAVAPRVVNPDNDDDDDDDDDDGFPTSGARVVKIEQLEGRRRYFDAQGRETLLDGRLLAEVQRDPILGPWLAELQKVDWSTLESAGGTNPPGFNLLSGIIAEDEGGTEKLSNAAWGGLYWHFCHQGSVYSGTAAVVPFLLRLVERKQQPHRMAIFGFLRAVGGAMRGTYQRAHQEGAEEGWADYLAVVAAYAAGYPIYRHLLDDADPKVRAWAARLLGSCHRDSEAAVRALGYRLIGERDPGVRGNLLQSLGNLGAVGADNILRRSLERGGLEQICAGIGMVMCKDEEAGIETVSALVSSLAEAHVVEEAFDEMPWSEMSIYAELANALAQTGRGASVLDEILIKLDHVDPLSSISIVRASLVIAHGLRGDDEDDDDGDGGAALRKVIRAVAASDTPWRINVNLHEVLDEFDLPTDREELAEAGKEEDSDDEEAADGGDGHAEDGDADDDDDDDDDGDDDDGDDDDGDDGDDDDDDGDDGDDGDDDDDADGDGDDDADGEEEDDAETSAAGAGAGDGDGDDDDDGDGQTHGGVTGGPAPADPAGADDFLSEVGSHTSLTHRTESTRASLDDDLDDEIDRSLGILDDGPVTARASSQLTAPTDPDDLLLAALDPSLRPSAESELGGFIENELLEDEPSAGGSVPVPASRSFPRAGSDAWLADVREKNVVTDDEDADAEEASEDAEDLEDDEDEELENLDAELEEADDGDGKADPDDGWKN